MTATDFTIRREKAGDYRAAEALTRAAFWNVHVPGCQEHFILHNLRRSADFIPELDFVAVADGQIVGHIVFSHSHILDEAGGKHAAITFGPVSVLPARQRQGVGSALIRHSLAVAKELGYRAVCIYGDPRYYSRFGFRCAEKYDIGTADGKFAVALLALELTPGALGSPGGRFVESPAFEVDEAEFEAYEKTFPPLEKLATPSQDEFRLMVSLRYQDRAPSSPASPTGRLWYLLWRGSLAKMKTWLRKK
jgi:putative acetyltransferase